MRTRWLRQAVMLVLIAVLPAIGEAIYFRDTISWESSIPASDLATVDQALAWGQNAIWVDARPDEEFQRDHVPGAISLNEDHWSALLPNFLTVWSPEKKVVVYCSSQGCNASREIARRLRNQTQPPIQNVFVLKGGWEEWLKSRK